MCDGSLWTGCPSVSPVCLIQPSTCCNNCVAAIEGPSERCVAEAKRRLEMITWSNRLRERITHFISIPLNLPALKEKLAAFHKEVMAKCSKVKSCYSVHVHVCDPTECSSQNVFEFAFVCRMRASVMMYFRFLRSYISLWELCVYLAEKRR